MKNSNRALILRSQFINTFDARLKSLKLDLELAWDSRNVIINEDLSFGVETQPYKKLLNSSNFLYSIDPQSMTFLEFLLAYSHPEYTLATLAGDIVRKSNYKTIINEFV
jgi:hypothetical protein